MPKITLLYRYCTDIYPPTLENAISSCQNSSFSIKHKYLGFREPTLIVQLHNYIPILLYILSTKKQSRYFYITKMSNIIWFKCYSKHYRLHHNNIELSLRTDLIPAITYHKLTHSVWNRVQELYILQFVAKGW